MRLLFEKVLMVTGGVLFTLFWFSTFLMALFVVFTAQPRILGWTLLLFLPFNVYLVLMGIEFIWHVLREEEPF